MSDKIPTRDVTPPSVQHHTPTEAVTQEMYASRRHIYVREIKGVFQRLRRASNWLLMLAFFLLPWVPWGDRPAIWFNLPGREFHIFSATFYPQEFMLLSWLLIICAFGLFFITVFAGRVWCGYTCPQSVWTFLFIWVEHRLEGSRNRRIKLDKQPMNADKLWRKGAKHAIWLIIALATGITFVGYFTPIRDLVVELPTLEAHGWSYFWVGFFLVFTYLNAGWLREQVCIYMCPYARFQSVMFDRDTLIVSYDAARGEPRGHRKKSLSHEQAREAGHGDCIDCDLCVQVCPTGIDIRDGLQVECISCAACIDACDSVMDKMGYPRGLIRYTTENALEGKPTHILRPRLIGYLAALLAMIGLFAWTVSDRTPLSFDVERDRNRLFQTTAQGNISNSYTITVRNMDGEAHVYRLEASGLPGLTLDTESIRVPASDSRQRVVTITVPGEVIEQPSHAITLRLTAERSPDISLEREARFLGELRR
ncbi:MULTISPECIES: cytochrome c oxidase accessory protein CcoG [unclassified Halomonas]|uniref:cytochrome c oxidase accessory protein CcoG n=1 Tax=unclassified Halomonas TaxID=2609666 RepID=UPI00288861FF|nr:MULTISPECIES: cytochrome c oxidase accessory protein CcoG [unclassified Halomonas]MDT0502480.1 cytochrome c oxidase accessory protein CcoG [Halomonas sp. PAR7]MDT0511833.1 cytochrome c oxidase accessory protein CcoG [Halomonas sp. LES1]MDT0593092.1 cytochrome c oxidase accessory protein CcoG [Halomonas sp. PAR8]